MIGLAAGMRTKSGPRNSGIVKEPTHVAGMRTGVVISLISRKKYRDWDGQLVPRADGQSGIHLNTILGDPMRPRSGDRLCVLECSENAQACTTNYIKQRFNIKN